MRLGASIGLIALAACTGWTGGFIVDHLTAADRPEHKAPTMSETESPTPQVDASAHAATGREMGVESESRRKMQQQVKTPVKAPANAATDSPERRREPAQAAQTDAMEAQDEAGGETKSPDPKAQGHDTVIRQPEQTQQPQTDVESHTEPAAPAPHDTQMQEQPTRQSRPKHPIIRPVHPARHLA